MDTHTDDTNTPTVPTVAPADAPASADPALDFPIRNMHKTHPHFLRTCGKAAWITWAMAQFNLFDHAPTPAAGGLDAVIKAGELMTVDFDKWLVRFKRWLLSGAASTRTRSAALFLLHAYNVDIKLRGAQPIEVTFGGMDSTNRAAAVTILSHWRTF